MKEKDIQLTLGCELEWSDIDRRVNIPEEFGSWEGPKIAGYHVGSEIDIVNTKGQWRGHGTDPLAIKCPVGGEIHVNPTYSPEAQLLNILEIMSKFDTISTACPNHGHVHVCIPGIKQNIQMLKNIFAYTQLNEADLIRECCGYTSDEAETVRNSKVDNWVKEYLLAGDGKSINPDLYAQVAEAESIEEILKLLETETCDDWYWDNDTRIKTENSHRTAFNIFNLTKGETVEFRIFRSSVNPVEIYSTLYFAKRYCEEAIKGTEGKSVLNILKEGNFKFPKLNFNESLALGWQETRSTKSRGAAFKHYTGTEVNIEPDNLSKYNSDLIDVVKLCKKDFKLCRS